MTSLLKGFVGTLSEALDFNQATLSGCIDIVVVEHDDGTRHSTPFHVRFGKLQLLRSREKVVTIMVNGEKAPFSMKLGRAGEAFFVEEVGDESIDDEWATSPIHSPYNSPSLSPSRFRTLPHENAFRQAVVDCLNDLIDSVEDHFKDVEIDDNVDTFFNVTERDLAMDRIDALATSDEAIIDDSDESIDQEITMSSIEEPPPLTISESAIPTAAPHSANGERVWTWWSWRWGSLPVRRISQVQDFGDDRIVAEVPRGFGSGNHEDGTQKPSLTRSLSWVSSFFGLFRRIEAASLPEHDPDLVDVRVFVTARERGTDRGGGRRRPHRPAMAMKGVLQTFKRRFSKESSLGVGSGSGSLQRGASGGAHSGDGALNKKDLLQPLPSFRECPASERQALMIKKLKLCSIVFDFSPASDPGKDNLGKEMKRQVLLELVDHISTTKAWFSEAVLQEIINMIQANLFRALPPSPTDAVWDPEEDDPVLDPAWAHLQIVYEFLLRFVVSSDTDTKLVKKYINGPFVLRILDLFMSEDPRERDYLKTILHRIYGKFMSLRSFIRKAINNVFFTFIYDSERHNGVGELLEILGSIINGFALPLKEEHKRFLKNVLIPLHKVRMLALFHQQLAYCVTQFIDKDPLLAPTLILGILQYWPITNSSKEVLFLNELEEILELTQPDQFQLVIDPLFRQIAKSIASPHFQVAERALFMWNNEYISSLTTDFRKRILPILYPALHANSKKHWNSTVHSLTFNVIRMFMEMDSDLFDSRSKKYTEETSSNAELSKKREEMWDQLEKQAQQKKLAGVA